MPASDAVELERTGRYARAAARLGDTAQVTCRARGVPRVTFNWTTNGTAILSAETGKKYQQQDTQVQTGVETTGSLVMVY